MARLLRMRRLNSVDFPTLGRPKRAILGNMRFPCDDGRGAGIRWGAGALRPEETEFGAGCPPRFGIIWSDSSGGFDQFLPAHVGNKGLGHDDGTVLLLIVFHDGHKRTSGGQPGAVQGMHPFGLSAFGTETGCWRGGPESPSSWNRRRFPDRSAGREAILPRRRSCGRRSPCPRRTGLWCGREVPVFQADFRRCGAFPQGRLRNCRDARCIPFQPW